MAKPKPLQPEIIKRIISQMKDNYQDPEQGALLLKNKLYELRFSIETLDEEQCREINSMISYKLKPLALEGKDETLPEGQRAAADGLYAVLRAHRGEVRTHLAWKLPISVQDTFYLTLSAANDHKRAADTVTNRFGQLTFRYYQRSKASTAYHKSFKKLEYVPDFWDPIEDHTIFFAHQEAYYNNKALFAILRTLREREELLPKYRSTKDIELSIAQTALYLSNNTTFLANNKQTDEEKITLYQEQEKYTTEAIEKGQFFLTTGAHLYRKNIQAQIQLHQYGFPQPEIKNQARNLLEIVAILSKTNKDAFQSHIKTANKAIYHLE